MPLKFPGTRVHGLSYVSVQATDSATGKPVTVRFSYEAIKGYGEWKVQDAASAKYDAGSVTSEGVVIVYTHDCK